jgi:hypothetical protein
MKAEAAQIRQVERKSTRLTNKRRRSRRRNFRPLTAGIRRSPPPPPPTPTKTHTNDPCKCGHAALRCAIVHSRRDFRPATGSETHVFGRVCSHNTISLPPPPCPLPRLPPTPHPTSSSPSPARPFLLYSALHVGRSAGEKELALSVHTWRYARVSSYVYIVRRRLSWSFYLRSVSETSIKKSEMDPRTREKLH